MTKTSCYSENLTDADFRKLTGSAAQKTIKILGEEIGKLKAVAAAAGSIACCGRTHVSGPGAVCCVLALGPFGHIGQRNGHT
jgi:hypothetical protein